MEDIPIPPDSQPIKGGKRFWRNLLYTFLGTTISIVLTFGTTAIIHRHHMAQERKLTTMMVIGNIEQYAQKLEDIYKELSWRDTLGAMLLSIPMDSLDDPKYSDVIKNVNLVAAFPGFNYDKSVEQIFSNSIDTWKNMGNFKFIDNVGKCFSSMNYIREDYITFSKELGSGIDEVKSNTEGYPGESLQSKILHNERFRSTVHQVHNRSTYYLYLSDYIRYLNAINMQLMDVTEEEVQKFIEEREEETEIDRPIPWQQDYLTPPLTRDSLPEMQSWIQKHKV